MIIGRYDNMKLDIPFFSQYADQIASEWQSRICAIACIKMVLDFSGKEIDPMKIVEDGLIISKKLADSGRPLGGYTNEFGWGHDVLVFLLLQNEILAYRQEFKGNDMFSMRGIEKIRRSIDAKKPVMVSLAKDIKNPKTSGHLVVVTGYDDQKGLYINDPEKKTITEGKDSFIAIEDFIASWKKLAIFVE